MRGKAQAKALRGFRGSLMLALVTITLHPACAVSAVILPAQATGTGVERDVARVRAATEAFKSLDRAVAAGYAPDVTQCVAHPSQGAMGYHHQNASLLDARIEVERPEMLVYERLPDGTYRLNGVEYIVPFSAWPQSDEPPTVMGQPLKPAPSLGIWYRHVWIWRENPAGLFADWHPMVKCPGNAAEKAFR